jgi:cytochrome P450
LKLFARPLNFLTARKAYLGRQAVHAALRDYFSAGYDRNDDASLLIKARTAVNRKWGFSPTDVADAETSMIFVSTTNAVPTVFWMFCYVFSNAQLSDELRNEVASAVTRQGSGDCVIDIAKFAQACPLINSVYQEVMRLTNIQNGTRFVMEDTVLEQPAYDGMPPRTIRLAKGTMVQMPASLVHVSPAVWGANASTFDARRFLKADQKENGPEANDSIQPDKRQKKLFYPFGGGRHLCPGRHLAYAEILGTMTMLLLGYDITDERGGLVTLPQKADLRFSGVKHPLGPDAVMAIRIRRKRGWEGVRWVFSSGGAK